MLKLLKFYENLCKSRSRQSQNVNEALVLDFSAYSEPSFPPSHFFSYSSFLEWKGERDLIKEFRDYLHFLKKGFERRPVLSQNE